MTDEEKKSAWEEIKKRNPQLANFLQKTKQLFGKYELKSVTFKEGTHGND